MQTQYPESADRKVSAGTGEFYGSIRMPTSQEHSLWFELLSKIFFIVGSHIYATD